MCGRTACTLAPDKIQKACCTLNNNSKTYQQLEWDNVSNGGHSYLPSYNVCPTNVTPVILNNNNEERILRPMIWGMIPPWHKGNYNDHKLSTNNCRIESILDSKLYKDSMIVGKRCVVICDGFYEWQTTKGKNKQPYFIYAKQSDGIKIDSPDSWQTSFSETDGWKGPSLLFMAALYNKWTSPDGEEMWSYSIVTMESDSSFNWIHHRVPAILDTETLVNNWLNNGDMKPKQILEQLKPNSSFSWHPVSTNVNNSRDKSLGLNRAIDLNEPKKPSKSATMMSSWLQKGNKNKRKSEDIEHDEKKKSKKEQ